MDFKNTENGDKNNNNYYRYDIYSK